MRKLCSVSKHRFQMYIFPENWSNTVEIIAVNVQYPCCFSTEVFRHFWENILQNGTNELSTSTTITHARFFA